MLVTFAVSHGVCAFFLCVNECELGNGDFCTKTSEWWKIYNDKLNWMESELNEHMNKYICYILHSIRNDKWKKAKRELNNNNNNKCTESLTRWSIEAQIVYGSMETNIINLRQKSLCYSFAHCYVNVIQIDLCRLCSVTCFFLLLPYG